MRENRIDLSRETPKGKYGDINTNIKGESMENIKDTNWWLEDILADVKASDDDWLEYFKMLDDESNIDKIWNEVNCQ